MNRQMLQLFKGMIPGLIPLIVFIVTDSLFGTKAGLIVSCVLGAAEFGFIYLKERRIDLFVLTDLGMIVFFAGISLLLDNDIFFKIKPAVMEAVLCVILGLSAFTPAAIMQGMAMRYMKGFSLSDEAAAKMRRSSAVMFFLFLGHTVLIVISAFYMSTAAWGFISGALFYIIFALYMFIQIAALRIQRLRSSRT